MAGRALRQHGPPFASGRARRRGRRRPGTGELGRCCGASGANRFTRWTRRAACRSRPRFAACSEEGDPDWAPGQNPNLVLIYGMPGNNSSRAIRSRAPAGSTRRFRGCRPSRPLAVRWSVCSTPSPSTPRSTRTAASCCRRGCGRPSAWRSTRSSPAWASTSRSGRRTASARTWRRSTPARRACARRGSLRGARRHGA